MRHDTGIENNFSFLKIKVPLKGLDLLIPCELEGITFLQIPSIR